jgi:hypothetical protein
VVGEGKKRGEEGFGGEEGGSRGRGVGEAEGGRGVGGGGRSQTAELEGYY